MEDKDYLEAARRSLKRAANHPSQPRTLQKQDSVQPNPDDSSNRDEFVRVEDIDAIVRARVQDELERREFGNSVNAYSSEAELGLEPDIQEPSKQSKSSRKNTEIATAALVAGVLSWLLGMIPCFRELFVVFALSLAVATYCRRPSRSDIILATLGIVFVCISLFLVVLRFAK